MQACLLGFRYTASRAAPAAAIDPLPTRSLHADLLDRFKTLSGNSGVNAGHSPGDIEPSTLRAERNADEKTVEELLADLGPSEGWNVSKSEHDQIEALLRTANSALHEQPDLENIPDEEDEAHKPTSGRLPSVDVSVLQPEPESDEEEREEPEKTKLEPRDDMNQEADDVLKRLMDEVMYEKEHGEGDDESANKDSADEGEEEADPTWDLPAAPSKELEDAPGVSASSNGDVDLAARFANLSLPSVPTVLKSDPKSQRAGTANKFTEEEVDSWCIICNDDATLSCLGCDGDLYCTNCWMEGHRSEDAGYEERSHKAVQYVKGGGKKKQKGRRVMMGG